MKAYPNYKDSGVPWLEHVPEHWEVLRLGSQFVERKQKVSDKDFAPLSVTKKGILPQLDTAAKSNDGDNRKKVCSGDFVINSRSDRKGSSGVSPHTGSVSLINTVLTPISLHGRYVHNFFRSHSFQEEFYRVGRGIVADLWSTKYADMRTIMIPVPTEDEQHQISRYLDWQTSKINKFIKAKKKLIALLKEQKQNVINEAVTKGINPDVEMKDSGVEWLGEIPAHWDVSKNKAVYSERREAGSKELPILSVSIHHGVSTEEQSEKENLRAKVRIQDREKYLRVYPNDIAFNMMRAWQGGIGVVQVHGMVSPAYIVAKPKKEIHSRFVELLFRTPQFVQEMNRNSRGITDFRKRLYWDQYKNISIVLPPLDEQQEIVAYIEKETALIDKTIARTEREIELIQEYRTRLVSDVVTGKVDVRSVEIPDFEPAETDLEVQDDEESEDELITEGIEE
ncbi:restriction endonuclease subunit S [Desulfatiferula olefinivorans]